MKTGLKLLIAFALNCIMAWPQPSSVNLRTVDFKNFSYPFVHADAWSDRLQWMSLRLNQRVRLRDGKWNERSGIDRRDGAPFSGLTLEGVQFASLSGSRSEDAIVALRYDSGGTQYHYWVYIYGSAEGTPRLLAFFHAGDRAEYGLDEVFEQGHLLHVRLFDPAFRQGDCCSSGYLDHQFRWNAKGFEAVGGPIPGRTDFESRRPVSIFGLAQDES